MSAEVLKTYINDLEVHRPIPQERRSATKKAAMRYLIEDRNACPLCLRVLACRVLHRYG